MAQPIKLTRSGAGIAMVKVPSQFQVGQVVGIVAKPGGTDVLDVTLYACPSYSTSAIPAGSSELGSFSTPASGPSAILDLSPDGIDVSGFLAADFSDADPAHAVYLYVK